MVSTSDSTFSTADCKFRLHVCSLTSWHAVTRIGFENIKSSVEEEAGFAELSVALLGGGTLGGNVNVCFHTSDLSSVGEQHHCTHVFLYNLSYYCITAGLDYMETLQDLIFNSSVQHIVVRVPIVSDAFSEETEQFRASLSLVENNGINVTLSPDLATVNITDDEGISIMNSVL